MARLQTDTQVVVVGAGVVGLAAAASLARSGRSVVVLERHDGIAQEITSRNSEVIHAGIYYPADSLKAELCRVGREALYARCAERGIGCRRLGKIIVATRDAELEVLEQLLVTATANGAPGLQLLDGRAVRELEPDVQAVGALLSPDTGIVDAHDLCLSYLAEAESHDADLVLRSDVVEVEHRGGLWHVSARDAHGDHQTIVCGAVVNAAGLGSDSLAELVGMDVDACGLRLHPCKGDYFSLAPGAPLRLSRLVYPVPVQAGLGVHATLDLGGRIRFGPDTEYIAQPHYQVDAGKAQEFAEAASRYLPTVTAQMLSPDYAGVRPKLAGAGEGFRDFVVREESDAGFPGLVNCIGIESPGLTAAGAIGERIVGLLSGL
jgi:L-2-hydroxyglutarate oxidase LhgO